MKFAVQHSDGPLFNLHDNTDIKLSFVKTELIILLIVILLVCVCPRLCLCNSVSGSWWHGLISTKSDKMLDKPRILSLSPTRLINSIKHDVHCICKQS